MDSNVRFMLDLIGYVLKGGDAPQAPEELDFEVLYRMATSHGVTAMVAYGLLVQSYDMDSALRNRFMEKMHLAIAVDEKQRADCEELFSALEEQGLDYLPLKGIELKALYPEPEMRQMSDGDILIRQEHYEAYKQVLEALGYTFSYESDHEWVFTRPESIVLELHKCLIPSYNEDMYAYYQKGWDIARQGASQRWAFSSEDLYVYLLTHFAKHYRDAGVGLKYVVDLWVLKRAAILDEAYVCRQLKAMHLEAFAKHVNCLINGWFEHGPMDEITEEMTAFIVSSGQFGTYQNAGHAQVLRSVPKNQKSGEKYKYIALLFPAKEALMSRYPALKKHGWLLPCCWMHRMVTWLLFRRQTARTHQRMMEQVSQEGLDAYRAHMQKVGLDLYNGRK